MKKATLKSLVALLNGEAVENTDAIKAELEAELAKDEARKQENADLYESAKDIVMGELRNASQPVTIGELYDAVADDLPEGFTKGKMQYAITRLWKDEVDKVEGNPNTYSAKA